MNILGIRRPGDGVLLAKDLDRRQRFISIVAFVVYNIQPNGISSLPTTRFLWQLSSCEPIVLPGFELVVSNLLYRDGWIKTCKP
jgi:hypothetical protein